MSRTDAYENRYRALNDALWLVERGATNPHPAPESRQAQIATGFMSSYGSTESPYERASVALDYARFLLDEEPGEVESPNYTVTVNGSPEADEIRRLIAETVRDQRRGVA